MPLVVSHNPFSHIVAEQALGVAVMALRQALFVSMVAK